MMQHTYDNHTFLTFYLVINVHLAFLLKKRHRFHASKCQVSLRPRKRSFRLALENRRILDGIANATSRIVQCRGVISDEISSRIVKWDRALFFFHQQVRVIPHAARANSRLHSTLPKNLRYFASARTRPHRLRTQRR